MYHTDPADMTAATPAQIYLAGLSSGSQGMRQSLDIIAGILSHDRDADTYPWWEVTYRDSMSVRIALADRYKPATVNKMLSALRGVLKPRSRSKITSHLASHLHAIFGRSSLAKSSN